jgi:hypothetical protein
VAEMNLCDKVPPLAVSYRQPWPGYPASVNESVSAETLSSISPNGAAALARLLGQLSKSATFNSGRLHAIIYHEGRGRSRSRRERGATSERGQGGARSRRRCVRIDPTPVGG